MDDKKSLYQSASLYVGDLDKHVTEAILFETFKSVGPVASIRVCRDAVTRQSLGYAYVNFHTIPDAEKALAMLNFEKIQGKACRIMWSQRDPSIRKSGQGNIFIKNLHDTIDNATLHDTFNAFGQILSCKVVTDENGKSRGYGFVHFESQEAANEALKVNGMQLAGKIVYVSKFVPRNKRAPSADPDKYTNLYVKNFPENITKEKLLDVFGKFGEIQSAAVFPRTFGDGVKYYGFVNFKDADNASDCVKELHGSKIFDEGEEGEALYVQRAMTKNERRQYLKQRREERAKKYQGINLYVKNLEDSIDDEKLRDVFSPFGKITSCCVMRDENNASRGFGFVCFTTAEEANEGLTQMNSAMLAGKPLYVALAERREVRQAKLASIYARMTNRGPLFGAAPLFYPQGYMYPPSVLRGGYNQRGRVRGYQRGYPYNSTTQRGSYDGSRSYKYSGNARNQPAPAVPVETAPAKTTPAEGEGASSTIGVLATSTPPEQKQYLGETLFPKIRAVDPENAGKITGMLLESLSMDELVHLTKSDEALHDQIEEALSVLSEFSK